MNDELKIRQERFKLLMEQVVMPDELITNYLQGAHINKLDVYTKSKRWHFEFCLPDVLPFQAFELFKSRIVQNLAHIATVDFTLTYEAEVNMKKHLPAYWPLIVETLRSSTNGLIQRLQEQTPVIEGRKVTIAVLNETEAEMVQRRVNEPLQQVCHELGFGQVELGVAIKESQEAMARFAEQKKEEDHHKVVEAMMEKQKQQEQAKDLKHNVAVSMGVTIKDEPQPIQAIVEEERRITIQGYVFEAETKELKSGRTLLTFKVTDYTDSIIVKMFSNSKEDVPIFESVSKGMWLKVRGSVQMDTFIRDLVMMAKDFDQVKPPARQDKAPEGEKRVELHLHSPMSQMDAVTSIGAYVEQAKKWGHDAIGLTDHSVLQAFPDAYGAGKKHDVKILYGVEANLVDDGVPIAYNPTDRPLLDATYVVFDVETTGLSAVYNTIIELAAVKVKNGEIIDKFESFANPHEKLSPLIIDLTGITDDMVENAPEVDDVLKDFHKWMGDDILVAHNASFDMGFLNAGYHRIGYSKVPNPVIDTLELGRLLYPTFKNHRLNTLCKKFNIELVSHHRAIYDAEATGHLLWKMVKDANEKEITIHAQLNEQTSTDDYKKQRPTHCIIYAKNNTGLKNLYKLVSLSHINYFYRMPRIPRSELIKHREGLIIGSGCDRGEVFEAMMQKSPEEVEEAAKFYDYLEIQPPSNYHHLVEKEIVRDELAVKDIIKNIIELGDKLDKKVVATGNVHYLQPEDHIYRKILIASQGGANPLNKQTLPQVHYRSTDEMLDCFSFLTKEKAKEVVVTNTQAIADEIDEIKPVPDDLFTPHIEGADEEIRDICYTRAKSIYGEELPQIVVERLEKELTSIISNGFSVIYLISQKLVKKSLEDGYLVGSRGSVGSSLVATMMEITEVNPLPPHYVCPSCHHSYFFNDGSVGSGFDLPDKSCEKCESTYKKDGHDIPFETFLGFKGDKVPDIDLNFSGDYQPIAHNYTKELFGEEYVYRAGTIGTVAEKTAYGYVKGYESDEQIQLRGAEIDRLVSGCTGVKRTTGQHPGGIIVVPDHLDIYDFSPIQFPADDRESEWKTTHFDFHSIHDNLLKLDILGHDDPTVIRMLQDLSGIDPKDIPVDDPEVFKLFGGTEALGVTEDQIMCKTGTYGIPEFGTRFVRQMLEETKPTTFSELVQISGLSHGTDVWLNNAADLIADGTCVLKDVIGCRDDIMVYLIYKGLEDSLAFKIMEFVRKGKGLQEEWIEEMKKHGVPDWYIGSCLKIKYMFPKAHAAAYVLMAIRIAYFKVHHPILFYAAYFTVRADDFELETMTRGSATIRKRIEEIYQKGLEATPKEKSLVTVLELALEMCERGFSFQKVDLYKSKASEFLVDGDSLIPPFNALTGVGTNAAINIEKARENGEFLSKEDLRQRSKITKTVLENLDEHGCLEGMPESNQLSLF
ncbi:PolC-type DNA polymerase III [Salipaludibacillus agaradhaerens]|uniref:PolC-type DNA polymerase III n=1 Tax=Salipaludibacillus agaradhaerens TaxID=76935 RepID=UPI0021516E1B|nr:PolC-type DNA polymerase III [Salipaludibacillus agaradhaerens]MCR6107031.1 PolC-type DNA polymerase III [Salipaludibacillus agaradhaerens]MCR6119062.1 PolC-type DNA polymerase III [Salipaludibacillus agaradhaerens]